MFGEITAQCLLQDLEQFQSELKKIVVIEGGTCVLCFDLLFMNVNA